MFSKSIALCAFSAILMGSIGCGRMMNGTKQTIGIVSYPEGATVTIEPGGITAVTPAKVVLKRNESYTAKIRKEGYDSVSAKISKHYSAWTLGNLVFPSVVMVSGLITDRVSGGAFKLTPKKINVTLIEKDTSPTSTLAAATEPLFDDTLPEL